MAKPSHLRVIFYLSSPLQFDLPLHDLTLRLGEFEVIAPIGFSERLGVGFNILGRKGIFDQFQVCFNDHTRKVTFQKI
jgi:hypothetical protein